MGMTSETEEVGGENRTGVAAVAASTENPDIAYQTCLRDSILSKAVDGAAACEGLLASQNGIQ